MASFTETLSLIIDAKTGGAVRDVQTFGKAVSGVGDETQLAAAKGGKLQSTMQSLGLTSVSSTALMAGGFIAAGAAIGKFGADSVAATTKLADGIRLVQQASGASADTASRLVAIFDDYNISAESGAKSLAKLGINLRDGGDKLAQYGIDVVKAKDGSTDFAATLGNIADAYKHSDDAGERSRLVMDAFGKSGRDLVPILEQGRAGIEKMFANVPRGQILSQEQIENARKYQLAVDDLNDVMLELKVTIGNAVIPILADMATALATISRGAVEADHALKSMTGVGGFEALGKGLTFGFTGVNALAGAFGIGGKKADEFGDAQKRLGEATKKVQELAAQHKTHTDEGREAQKELTDATNDYDAVMRRATGALAEADAKTKDAKTSTKDYADVVNIAADALKRYADSTLEVANQQLGLEGAEQNVEQAIINHTKAVNENGDASLEARESQTRLQQSVLAASAAALKAAEAQATLEGRTLSSADKINIQRGELESLKQKFPELTPIINEYLWKLGQIPESKTTYVYAMTDEASYRVAAMKAQLDALPSVVTTSIFADIFGGVKPSFQHGGAIPGGVNDPYPIIAHGGEYVLSADVVDRIKAARPSRGARGGGGEMLTVGNGTTPAAGPLTINLSLNGEVLGSVAVDYINRRSTRGPGPLLSGAVVG